MRLFIAEKPAVAEAIAKALGVTGRGSGYIECGPDKTTWCYGHMLEQAEPDDVPRNKSGRKIWRTDELPIIPQEWILRPKNTTKKQLAVIGKLIREASEIVNAGDPDREGQLLVDQVLEHFRTKKLTRRFWVSAQDAATVARGLADMQENNAYKGWADAARGRSRADWLIGMNLSRAYTLQAQQGGSRVLLTVGRVQTPTLALVVMRDREIAAFEPVPYHTIEAVVQHVGGSFVAAWKAREDQLGLDSEGRLVDSAVAAAVVAGVSGKPGRVAEYKQETKKQSQPLLFTLAGITVLASSRYGYSAEDVLNTCQALYETHKLTSYPRTDCAYLPESQLADAASVLAAVKHVNPELADLVDGADLRIKSKIWNDSKITAHHGIVPTMHKGGKAALNERERNVYELIVRVYLAQFHPPHEYIQTSVNIDVAGETFTAGGKVVVQNGWRDVYDQADKVAGGDRADSDNQYLSQRLPMMEQGDNVTCASATRKDSKTRAPNRFTEGTLVHAMENIPKFVTGAEYKMLLREGDGVGTPATRASIIAELKRRQFLETKGKHLVSTPLGRSMIDALPEVVKSPVLTALYERMLKGIEQGTTALETFVAKQEAFVRIQVSRANEGTVAISGTREMPAVSRLHKCMTCGAGLLRRPSKNQGHFWWGCSNYPACRQTYADLDGLPDYSKGRNTSTGESSITFFKRSHHHGQKNHQSQWQTRQVHLGGR